MSRFRLTQAIALAQVKFHAGEIVTDLSVGVTGDRYWAELSSAVLAPGMVPLDGGASEMKDASAFKGEVIRACICGVDSIG